MNHGRTTGHDVRRNELGKIAFNPKACGLDFAVTEHPGLHHLIRFADMAGDDRDGVFKNDAAFEFFA